MSIIYEATHADINGSFGFDTLPIGQVAMKFIPSSTETLKRIELGMWQSSYGGFDILMDIYNGGTDPLNGTKVKSAITDITVVSQSDLSQTDDPYSLHRFSLHSTLTLTSGETYWFVIRKNGGYANTALVMTCDNPDGYDLWYLTKPSTWDHDATSTFRIRLFTPDSQTNDALFYSAG